MQAPLSSDVSAFLTALWDYRYRVSLPDWTFRTIGTCLFLWIYAAYDFLPPWDTLKRRALISAWIIVPAAIPYATLSLLPGNDLSSSIIYILLVLTAWTEAASAVMIGNIIRRQIFGEEKSPPALSLSFAVVVLLLVIGIIGYYLVLPNIFYFNCSDAPFSILGLHCSFVNDLFNFSATSLIAFVIYGFFISSKSILVKANNFCASSFQRIPAHLDKIKSSYERAQTQRTKLNEEDSTQCHSTLDENARYTDMDDFVPPEQAVADLPTQESVADVPIMCLKLKRSQKTTFMGKVIFALDARMELPAEERSLVAKYGLLHEVVYESNARKEHRSAAMAHAESTREQASFRDSAAAQAWGLTKTLYRFGRTGISATRAALALRVTIESLTRGVHVECEDMDELLDSEEAIVSAARNLKGYLESAGTFNGREQIIEL